MRDFFHGTASSFERFSASHCGQNTNYPGADRAFFFAAHACNADHYAQLAASRGEGEPRVLRVRLSVERVLVLGFCEADSSVDADTLESLIDDDEAAFDYAERHGFDAVEWPYGNANNADHTIAVFSADHIEIVG